MSANTTNFPFPAPIGGVLLTNDFPPSLFFEIVYILITPLAAYRLASKTSRTVVIVGVAFTSAERILNFAFRMAQADNSNLRTSKTLLNWVQGAYCTTFLALSNDLLHIARAYLVNTTRSRHLDHPAVGNAAGNVVPDALDGPRDTMRLEELVVPDTVSKSSRQSLVVNEVEIVDIPGLPDEPMRRLCFRSVCIILATVFVAASIAGAVSGGTYFAGITNRSEAMATQTTRFLETILGLIVLQSTNILLLVAWVTRPRRVDYKRVLYLCAISCILTIPPVYRLAVMSATTTSLLASAPDALNSHSAKALFYGLHIFPELVGAMLFLVINVKVVYNTGTRGDWRVRDQK